MQCLFVQLHVPSNIYTSFELCTCDLCSAVCSIRKGRELFLRYIACTCQASFQHSHLLTAGVTVCCEVIELVNFKLVGSCVLLLVHTGDSACFEFWQLHGLPPPSGITVISCAFGQFIACVFSLHIYWHVLLFAYTLVPLVPCAENWNECLYMRASSHPYTVYTC